MEQVVEGEVKAPVEEVEVVVAAGETPSAPPIATPSPDKDALIKTFQARIDKVTAQRRLAEQSVRELESKLATVTKGPVSDETRLEELAEIKAKEILKTQAMKQEEAKFNQDCDNVVTMGNKTWTDFSEKLEGLKKVFNDDRERIPQWVNFVKMALETGEGAKVIYNVDPDTLEDIIQYPPTKMAMTVAKLASAEPANASNAPRPIKVVAQGRSAAGLNQVSPSDPGRGMELPLGEWLKRREIEIKSRKG